MDGVPLEVLAFGGTPPGGAFAEQNIVFTGQWVDNQRFVAVTGAGRWPTANKNVSICDIETLSCRVLAVIPGTVGLEPALSFDRTRIAFIRAADRDQLVGFSSDSEAQKWMETRSLWLVDVRSGEMRELVDAGRGALAPAWSRDGQQLLLTHDRAAWLYDLKRNVAVKIVEPLGVAGPFSDRGWSFAWYR